MFTPPEANSGFIPKEAFVPPEASQAEPTGDTMLNKVAHGIEAVTGPISNAVGRIVAPGVKTLSDISKLPDKAPSLLKPAAEVAAAPAQAALFGLKALGTGSKVLEKAGDYIAEKGGQYAPPEVAAAAGTLVSKAPDFLATLSGGKAALEAAEAAAAKKAAIEAFVKEGPDVAALPPQPELPIGPVEDTAKPVMKLEKLTVARKLPDGSVVKGHNSGEVTRQIMDLQLQGKDAEANAVRKAFLESKGFVDAQGEFIPPEAALQRLEGQGPGANEGFARERSFISDKSGVTEPPPAEPPAPPIKPIGPEISGKQQKLFDESIPQGKLARPLPIKKPQDVQRYITPQPAPEEQIPLVQAEDGKLAGEPFKAPSPEATVQPKLPVGRIEKGIPTEPFKVLEDENKSFMKGSMDRVKAFQTAEIPDIDKYNPLTSRVELNKKLGPLQDKAVEQFQAGAKASMEARKSALDIKQGLKQFPVKPGSLNSEVLATYTESPNKMESYGRLVQAVGQDEADKVVAAHNYMKATYDRLLPMINRVRTDNGLSPIPYRSNYMPHMNEVSLLDQMGLTDLIGTPEGEATVNAVMKDSEALKQSAKFGKLKDVVFGHTHRIGGEYAQDAVESFTHYVDGALNYIKMQPYVNELNASASAVENKLPNLSVYLRDQANFIAGKKHAVDAAAESMNKPFVKGFEKLQRVAVGNLITGNPTVAYTQLFGELPAFAKYPTRDFLHAAFEQVTNPELRAYAYAHSPVLQDRALDEVERAANSGAVRRSLNKVTAVFDYEVANHTWITGFLSGIRSGMSPEEAAAKAEEFTALSQGFTSKVNTPPLMRSKLFQAGVPLQNQSLAAARTLSKHLWTDTDLAGKAKIATKLGISGAALAAVFKGIFGRDNNPLTPTNFVPLGGTVERGIGGPVFGSAHDIYGATSSTSRARAAIKAAFLFQPFIPAGEQVGRFVTDAVLGPPEHKRK